MMKGRRVMMMMDSSSPSSSSLPFGEEEARKAFKHQALFQDYQELLRETEAKKRKLQRTFEKKLRLTAEVKFLTRKYKSFARKQSPKPPIPSKKIPRKKPSPPFPFAQPKTFTSMSNPTLQEKNQRAREADAPGTSAMFDLNKVSLLNAEEMEGVHAEWEPLKAERLNRCSVNQEAALHDLNLSIFKDVANASSRVGKRKISWQDQLALRV